ncbi:MAG TPA: LacI family DNA-binding transcriptional regulator [Pyrodictium delaneyi]|uniref:LacI family DNA-binding transcriptional regulator n=1 Tax=Pyrodictium delaneyi TaxID=1273541 RepID=A0A832ZUP0_9CREN|nr:LacI family DNA-binding transcriptional regulator [Pyrodictium delaneyi]
MAQELQEVCEAIALLDPKTRRRLVEIALENGYAAKDVAAIMGVSPAAVSRYIHESLSPSTETLCKMIHSIDPETRTKILAEAAHTLWRALERLLQVLPPSPDKMLLAERIADKVSIILAETTLSSRSRKRNSIEP